MTFVEHPSRGFQWAEPLHRGRFSVELISGELEIIGRFPTYSDRESLCDLIYRYEMAPKNAFTKKGLQSPEVLFANADSDEKLISFVERFGPVVAQRMAFSYHISKFYAVPGFMVAHQDLQELRDEQSIYRAALTLALQFDQKDFDEAIARTQLEIIASKVKEWPTQWEREKVLRRGHEPPWRLVDQSLDRIITLNWDRPIPFVSSPILVASRIVLSELLNAFRSTIFPNPLEMHSSISHGIRPLLYSLLRRQLLFPRDLLPCKNTSCRNFFRVGRAGGEYCSPEHSLQQRQQNYWLKKEKKTRKKRLKKLKGNAK